MELPNIFAKKYKKIEKMAFYLCKSKNITNPSGLLFYDITNSDVSKGVAARYLCDYFNIDYLDSVIFIGGTTEYLKEQIADIEHSKTTDNSQWATTDGIFKVALKKFKK